MKPEIHVGHGRLEMRLHDHVQRVLDKLGKLLVNLLRRILERVLILLLELVHHMLVPDI